MEGKVSIWTFSGWCWRWVLEGAGSECEKHKRKAGGLVWKVGREGLIVGFWLVPNGFETYSYMIPLRSSQIPRKPYKILEKLKTQKLEKPRKHPENSRKHPKKTLENPRTPLEKGFKKMAIENNVGVADPLRPRRRVQMFFAGPCYLNGLVRCCLSKKKMVKTPPLSPSVSNNQKKAFTFLGSSSFLVGKKRVKGYLLRG